MMRRTVAIIFGLVLCISLAGCTMTTYFGGWAKVGGVVVDAESYDPLAGVQVTLTPHTNPSEKHTFVSDIDGSWKASYWIKRDRYTVVFTLNNYDSVERTEELSERWFEYDMGVVPMRRSTEPEPEPES